MGLDVTAFDAFVDAKRRGVDFSRTLTLGRQSVHLRLDEVESLFRRVDRDLSAVERDHYRSLPYADELFTELLGADEVVTMDHSDYEGASVVHDLNHPVAESHHAAFDVVIDGGTLEHVFNFPTAVANCMRMVKLGGRFFSLTPTNNYCGHGLYQFSFELFFRLFHNANGFELVKLQAIEHPFPSLTQSRRRVIYDVHDPAEVGQRVMLINDRPVLMFLEAEKVADVEPLRTPPQQSDYVAAWNFEPRKEAAYAPSRHWIRQVFHQLPGRVKQLTAGCYQRWIQCSLGNRRHFRPVRR